MRIHTPDRKNSPRVLKNAEGKIIATFSKDADIVEIKTIEKAFAYQRHFKRYHANLLDAYSNGGNKKFKYALTELIRHPTPAAMCIIPFSDVYDKISDILGGKNGQSKLQ
jgi:hypothetical protein